MAEKIKLILKVCNQKKTPREIGGLFFESGARGRT